jgi:hypothetical protein
MTFQLLGTCCTRSWSGCLDALREVAIAAPRLPDRSPRVRSSVKLANSDARARIPLDVLDSQLIGGYGFCEPSLDASTPVTSREDHPH